MTETLTPRLETAEPFVVAGLSGRYTHTTAAAIPELWTSLDDCIDDIPNRVGDFTYGAAANFHDDGFDYVAGVEVSSASGLPSRFRSIDIPAGNYAVFTHDGPIRQLPHTYARIRNEWMPTSGFAVVGPEFERYGTDSDGAKDSYTVEIWLPVEKSS
ncbi:GyrI-like domain-containing protein [Antrihabitans cavernicola]|uniref:AraC family transcriptional regulator n=1 Tax=Antrihabitans cavernicola TaxID=2495913 RepID=A0A5A7SBC5_9NOCA|nr:GyrI-like domain-containing protein [Spelaeibacter cavernicola]KAA0023440.1 AraC family transcriptional regulator [Spelaeibacter cavernicola]